ncbi:hypothetical protein [Catenuloplanes japonicus]|uniref:hypothetical protein n=1 Tax=Catenuloplanes japonicus TaxID=33876 RepID=UPI0012F771F3|nr:hypothetical protein [Catenuloplanes japonicus]
MRTDLWRACAQQYLAPHLPGSWTVSGSLLHHSQNEWIICALYVSQYSKANWFTVERLVQLLPIPATQLEGPFFHTLTNGPENEPLVVPENVELAAPVMTRVLNIVQAEAMPYFKSIATIDGYLTEIWERSHSAPANFYHLEKICYILLLKDDVTGAREAFLRAVNSPATNRWPEAANKLKKRMSRVMSLAESSPDLAKVLLREWSSESWRNISGGTLKPPD